MDPVIKTIKIISEDGGSEPVDAEQIGEDLFKLLENPVFNCRINYGTIVKAVEDSNGELVLSKIVRASGFITRQFFIDPSRTETELRTTIGQPIIDIGGTWEVVMGGIVFIHIPREANFDLDEHFRKNNYYASEIVDDSRNKK